MGDEITVEFAGHSASATADRDSRWMAVLPALPAGGPHTLTVTSRGARRTIADVLVGEVWVCAGQSNMELQLALSADGAAAVAAANHPQICLFTVPRNAAAQAAHEFDAAWCPCTPENAASFSAVGYHFGCELQRRLHVPVGLIQAVWGGTTVEAWTDRGSLEAEPVLAQHIAELERQASMLIRSPERVAKERAGFLAKLPRDAGNRGWSEGWAECDYDDTQWGTMTMPAYWNGKHPTNGVFWFRLAVDVPAAWAGRELKMSLGAVDKSDDSYVNGVRVGGMNWSQEAQSWDTPRNYVVPAAVIKPGRNVIAVRVLSNYTGGGMGGPGSLMRLHAPSDSDDLPLTLAGEWRYRIEQDFGLAPAIPEPQLPAPQCQPARLFNGMIAPLIPYGLRGAIWYQGESNTSAPARYRDLFQALIMGWRRAWQREDLGFYFVQLPNYADAATERNDGWAVVREAQASALALANTGMAVTIDIGDPRDIHPRRKEDVGKRLAYSALTKTYRQDLPHRGPCYRKLSVTGATARIEFDFADGLTAKGGVVSGFAIAGADRIFHPASAQIAGRAVLVSSRQVPVPVAVRYGWANAPLCTLYNGDGLPAEPFRTDDWGVG